MMPKQNEFSFGTAALAAVPLVIMLSDLFVGGASHSRIVIASWVAAYLLLTALPLALGERSPKWLGAMLVAHLTFWSAYSLVNFTHAHMELNALLESPMIAIYLGWFFSPGWARTMVALHLLAVSLAMPLRIDDRPHAFHPELALLYAILIAWLCAEAAILVRARADRAAWRDELTGALNRRGLLELGSRDVMRAAQSGEPLSLAAIDFDDFKSLNDAGGHAAGDRALRSASERWAEGLGRSGYVARIGGDEFVLVFHQTESEACARLLRMHEEAPYSWSWGLVQLGPGETLEQLIARADVELYAQKAASARW